MEGSPQARCDAAAERAPREVHALTARALADGCICYQCEGKGRKNCLVTLPRGLCRRRFYLGAPRHLSSRRTRPALWHLQAGESLLAKRRMLASCPGGRSGPDDAGGAESSPRSGAGRVWRMFQSGAQCGGLGVRPALPRELRGGPCPAPACYLVVQVPLVLFPDTPIVATCGAEAARSPCYAPGGSTPVQPAG